jgi:hypothetical protein
VIWRQLIRKTRTAEDAREPSQPAATSTPVEAAASDESASAGSIQDQRRLAGLQRQQRAIQFDIDQGELASAADNPWSSRIALLGEALDTVKADLERASRVEPGPWHDVPSSTVEIAQLKTGDVSSVSLDIAGERFEFAEDPDWAERGHQLARLELTPRSGDPMRLVPPNTPSGLRDALGDHLAASLLVLATDLRDRSLDNEPLPDAISLTDLARPCPICGGWTDWRGTCQACAHRQALMGALRREEGRLLDERNAEVEHRHKLVEGLPLARRRLKDVETEIARLGG